ncbi:MAG: acyl-CoA dehydrogenase family protein [Actinomycetota bacterium]|nr:acyl-CoA dehydrogenase family protein [Actinomycetota bacterium]
MGFSLEPTDEQRALKETLHEFAEEILRPRAREAESARRVPDDIVAQAHEIGITAPVAQEYGGGGTLDAVTYCIAAEELGWGDAGIGYQLFGSGLAAVVIAEAGEDHTKTRYLPVFAQEPARSFVALGEKFAGGDLETLATSIDGDKVSGEKYGVLNPTDATVGVVVGRDTEGLRAVVIAGDSDYEVVKPEDKLGLEAAPTSVVRFDGIGEALEPGPGLEKAILWGKLLIGALAVGSARASFEYAAQYATEREAFGKPIGAFQGISFKIADMAIEVDAARLSVLRAAWKLDRGDATLSDVAEAVGQALTSAIRCGDDGVQVLGGHGYIRDHPVEMWFRNAVTLSVFDAPDVLGDAMVARSVAAG